MTFICDRIAVILSDDGVPLEFSWKGNGHRIAEVERRWQEYGLPKSGFLQRQTWLLRRHRLYFQVQAEGGRRLQIYLDRGSKGSC